MRLRMVQQVDAKGCGVACVAMASGKHYAHVRWHALQSGDWRPSYGMNGEMLKRMLARMRSPAIAVTSRATRLYTRRAIVKVLAEVVGARKWQHYVVWDDGHVYDPGTGVLWRGTVRGLPAQRDGEGDITGLELYLASVPNARTGRWYWV